MLITTLVKVLIAISMVVQSILILIIVESSSSGVYLKGFDYLFHFLDIPVQGG